MRKLTILLTFSINTKLRPVISYVEKKMSEKELFFASFCRAYTLLLLRVCLFSTFVVGASYIIPQ